MPKATRKSVRVTSESELQEDSNITHESSSEDEVELQVQDKMPKATRKFVRVTSESEL